MTDLLSKHFQGHSGVRFSLSPAGIIVGAKRIWQICSLCLLPCLPMRNSSCHYVLGAVFFFCFIFPLPHQWIIYKSRVCMKLKQNAHKFCNEANVKASPGTGISSSSCNSSHSSTSNSNSSSISSGICLATYYTILYVFSFLAEGLVSAQAFNINEL